ncbi:MAG: hypothetical protein K6A33_11010 [Clostridiales bacterium]|nr:hypothetical protein [Clostridiales bacterium]
MDETEAIHTKMTVGYERVGKRRSHWEDVLFAVGILALGVTLAGPVARGERREAAVGSREAVAVMQVSSDAVPENGMRDVLAQPDRYAALEEDWSVFDEIGTFFANLIRGE